MADFDAGAATEEADMPILGINMNALRLNVCKRGGSLPHDNVGIFEVVGGSTVVQQKPTLFQRIVWKRSLSFDKPRRSFFMIGDVQTGATYANTIA